MLRNHAISGISKFHNLHPAPKNSSTSLVHITQSEIITKIKSAETK